MGNLGRAGYGASVDGMWPYSYDTCDVGTLPNQTCVFLLPLLPSTLLKYFPSLSNPDGNTPTAAKTRGDAGYGGELSYVCFLPFLSSVDFF
jgi:beta-glucanase (GH16 family)